MNFDKTKEYILDAEKNNNYNLFPIRHPDIWRLAKVGMSAHWVAEEIKFDNDLSDWQEKLTDNERFFIKNVLAFFSVSDGIVNENLAINFYNEVKVSEAKYFYANQIQMEAIHCVKDDTKILTSNGYHEIGDLVDQFVDVWNGYEFSTTQVKQTGEAATLYRVTLNNGMYLDCTSKHKWYTDKNELVLTKDLVPCEVEGTELKNDFSFPVKPKDSGFSKFDFYTKGFTCNDAFTRDQTELHSRVPLNFKESEKRDFLQGLRDYHGEEIYSKCDTFLNKVQLMLTTLNISSTIGYNTFAQEKYLRISCNKMVLKVVSVEELPGLHKTFCFNEPKRHLGIFNGILTGQSETYSLLIDTYITDEREKQKINNAIENSEIIRKKAEWAFKWMDGDTKSFPERLIAFCIVEGVFFSGSFCAIFWLKERKLMPALVKANKFISRDEKLHCDLCVLLYTKHLLQKLPSEVIYDMFREAVELETEFITESIPVSLLGMNSKNMIEYIKYTADNLIARLGYKKIYNVKNPFVWMESSSLENKSNMFEVETDSYAKAGIGNNPGEDNIDFSLDL